MDENTVNERLRVCQTRPSLLPGGWFRGWTKGFWAQVREKSFTEGVIALHGDVLSNIGVFCSLLHVHTYSVWSVEDRNTSPVSALCYVTLQSQTEPLAFRSRGALSVLRFIVGKHSGCPGRGRRGKGVHV